MELTFEQISDLLKTQKKDKEEYAFSLEERQLAAKASSEAWGGLYCFFWIIDQQCFHYE